MSNDGVQRIQFSIGKKVEEMDFDDLKNTYEEVKEKYDSSIFDANGDGKVSGGEIYAGLLSIQSGKAKPKKQPAPAVAQPAAETTKTDTTTETIDTTATTETTDTATTETTDTTATETTEETDTRPYEQIMAAEAANALGVANTRAANAKRLATEAQESEAEYNKAKENPNYDSTKKDDEPTLSVLESTAKADRRTAETAAKEATEAREYANKVKDIADKAAKYPAVPVDTEKVAIRSAYEHLSETIAGGVKHLDIDDLDKLLKTYEEVLANLGDDAKVADGNERTTADDINDTITSLKIYIAYRKGDTETVDKLIAKLNTGDAATTTTTTETTATTDDQKLQEALEVLKDYANRNNLDDISIDTHKIALEAMRNAAKDDINSDSKINNQKEADALEYYINQRLAKIPAVPADDAPIAVKIAYEHVSEIFADGKLDKVDIPSLEKELERQEEALTEYTDEEKAGNDGKNTEYDNTQMNITALKLYIAYRKGDTEAVEQLIKENTGLTPAKGAPVVPDQTAPKEVQDAYTSLMDKENGYLSENINNPESMTIEYLESVSKEIDNMSLDERSALPEGTKINLDLYIAYRKGDTDEVNKIIKELQAGQKQVPVAAADDNAPNEPIENATLTRAAIVYQYAPIDNIMSAIKSDATKTKAFDEALSAVAQFYPQKEDDKAPIDTVRKLTLEEIDYAINAAEETGHKEGKEAFEKLKAIVMENKDALNNGVLRHEAKEQVEPGMLAKAWGGTVATFKFLDEHVLGISEANAGAKNAGKATGAQFKVNAKNDGILPGASAILSGAGRIGAFVPSFASGAMGKVTNAGEKLTDAVDNMEDGALKDAARTGSGAVKMVDGVVNIFAGGVADQLSAFGKEGLFINQIWGASDNDEAIEELTNVAVDRILETLTSREERDPLKPLKKDATDEEKEAYAKKKEEYEQKCEQDKIEAAYLVKVKDRLGLDDEALSKMSVSEKRNAIVRSVKDDRIPSEFIRVFAAKGIIEKGLIDQSKLLNNDSAEGIAKVKKGAGQVVDGAKDVVTGAANTVDNVAGLLLGGKGLFWGKPGLVKSVIPDEKPEQNDKAAAAVTGAAAPVHTASTKEIIAEIREKRIAAWKAKEEEKWVNTILPKIEAKKNEIIDKMVPSDYIQGAIDAIVKESEGRVTAEEAKRTIYKELGDKLEKNFSEFEKQRLFKRAMNEGEFGEDTFWADFFNWVDDATEQENSAGGRGFLKNFYTTALSFAGAPVKAVFGDMPYTVAQLAGGVPFIAHQCFFMMFFGGSEHLEGLGNIIEGYSDYNSAQVATGYAQSGYALAKDWFISWGKHAVRKIVGDDTYCGCKPKPKPEPEPTPTEHENFFNNPINTELTLPD